MLSPFPELFFLGILAPTILRITAGIVFLSLVRAHGTERAAVRESAPRLLRFRFVPELVMFAEFLLGAALLVGLFTQIAAIVGLAVAVKGLALRRSYPALFPLSASSYTLLGAICMTLVITGAGAFAFDLPL